MDEIERNLDEVRQLIQYVEHVNEKWKVGLSEIDPSFRPTGYRNQLDGIGQQERILRKLRERAAGLERKINSRRNHDAGDTTGSSDLFTQEGATQCGEKESLYGE